MRKLEISIGRGWFIIYTHNLNPENFEQFKKIIGNPSETKWYVFPSEYVSKVEYVGPWGISTFVHMVANKIKRWINR